MAVVINNFEMPKHCFNCSRKINPEERQCNIDHHVFEETLGVITNYRDKDCPLLEIPQLEDCVSRAELKKWLDINFSFGGALRKLEMFDRIDKELPPVTPTRKVGKWVYDKVSQNWRCSECNETPKTLGYVGTADFMAEHFRFCNHCGAEMEGSSIETSNNTAP